MPFEPNTPGIVNVARAEDVSFTHISMVALLFKFPDFDPDGVQAQIIWRKGELIAGEFSGLSEHTTIVPAGPVTSWLSATNTQSKKNYIKLEEAMFNYLVSNGDITPGTIVELP